MSRNRVAPRVQERVKMWMNYTWSQQKSFDETEVDTRRRQFYRLTSMGLILLDRRSMNLLVGFSQHVPFQTVS